MKLLWDEVIIVSTPSTPNLLLYFFPKSKHHVTRYFNYLLLCLSVPGDTFSSSSFFFLTEGGVFLVCFLHYLEV